MRVALVHDQLIQLGGAEMVLEVMMRAFPEAPVHTLFYDEARLGGRFPAARVKPSFLQGMPFWRKHYQWYLPLMPSATEAYDLRGYDVVVSSASAFAKGVITSPGTRHICYCHTPTRYLWVETANYVESMRRSGLAKLLARSAMSPLRVWDRLAADRVDSFLANSRTVQERIKHYYHRDSTVLYPPVGVQHFSAPTQSGEYFLIGGRLVPYKRFDLAIAAFAKLGLPLKIFGEGPEYRALKRMAPGNVEFLGMVSDAEKKQLYEGAIAFLHPHVEDFGITAVEAMASGRPVIAYAAGGALETVKEGVSGVFFREQTVDSLVAAVRAFAPERFPSGAVREHALQFGEERFIADLQRYARGS